jgi:hypothetical protein
MAIAFAKLIGGFVHWLLHRCKTSLRDEIRGNLDATWGGTYDTENYIIGVVTVVIILGIVVWLFF